MTDINDAVDLTADAPDSDAPRGRRDFLGKAAVAAAVTTVAGLSMSRTAAAGVGNGVNMTQGAANTAATITTSLAGGSTFLVTNGGTAGAGGRLASVYGNTSTTQGVGVIGNATGSSGRGVYGRNTGSSGVGVYGEHNNTSTSGTGVYGISNFGVGVVGAGSTYDLQANGSGRVLLSANGVANPPAGTSTVGTIAKDSTGNLWACVETGTPGKWRKLAGVGTAGAFHALSPGRVYDSRAALPTPGSIAGGQNRTISVADKRDKTTGAVTTAGFVPAGATAVAANITIVSVTGAGFLTVNPGGTVDVDASTINWSAAGQALANGVTLTLNANRELTVVAGGGGSTDFLIDISGYYL